MMNKNLNNGFNGEVKDNETKSNKKRIFYFDQIRALAIVLVVMIHVCNVFMKAHNVGSVGWMIPSFTKGFCVIAVPLFLMISGALLLNRDYELKDFLSRRFVRLILPVIFWGIIYILLKTYANTSSLDMMSIYDTFLWFLSDGYWFSWMLISIYLFIPVINSFIKEYKLKGVEYFLVIWFIYLILYSFEIYPLWQIDLSYFAGFIGFVILGYYINNKDFNLSPKKMYIIGLLLYLTVTLINCYLRTTYLDPGELVERQGVLAALQACGVFLFIKYFAIYSENNQKSISNRIYSFFKDTVIGKLIFIISICSYGIYLTHYYFLHIGCGWINKNIFAIYSTNPLKAMPVILVVVVILSTLLVLLASKIPHLKKWTGMG